MRWINLPIVLSTIIFTLLVQDLQRPLKQLSQVFGRDRERRRKGRTLHQKALGSHGKHAIDSLVYGSPRRPPQWQSRSSTLSTTSRMMPRESSYESYNDTRYGQSG
jgi:hypothetical protein